MGNYFIGPCWEAASAYNFIMQFVGEIDHTQAGTDFQLRQLGIKASYFINHPSDKYRDLFAVYIERNAPEIEKCFNTFVLRDLEDWDWDILKNLTHFGIVIPENFLRDAKLRRKLTLPSLKSKDCS